MPCRPSGYPRGKLKAAATAWAKGRDGPSAPDPATDASAAQLAAIAARRGTAARSSDIELSPDEVDAVALFRALASQWRVHPMAGHRLGLEYAAITPTAAMMDITMTPALFDDLRMMEGAALAAFPRA